LGRLETKEKCMSTKSSESTTMRAMLLGAALAGLIAGTTSAQASVAGARTSVSTQAAGHVAGDVTPTGSVAKRRPHTCHRRCAAASH
jgi:hypothetical protein